MKIHLRFFASLREALGASETLDVPAGTTVGQLREQLVARGGAHAERLAPGRAVRAALNQQMAADTDELVDGAEVAFFPPVTGG